jgi:hypothetical protein
MQIKLKAAEAAHRYLVRQVRHGHYELAFKSDHRASGQIDVAGNRKTGGHARAGYM